MDLNDCKDDAFCIDLGRLLHRCGAATENFQGVNLLAQICTIATNPSYACGHPNILHLPTPLTQTLYALGLLPV